MHQDIINKKNKKTHNHIMSLYLNKNGISSAKLYHHTDAVVTEVHSVSKEEAEKVTKAWPNCLRNILIISIREERLKKCKERLGGLGVYTTVIPGVNGENLDLSILEEKGELSHINDLNKLTRGQVGCFLAHRKAWEHLSQSNEEYAFIIEDDCNLRPAQQHLDLITKGITEASKFKWDILYIARNPALCKTRKRLGDHLVQVGKTWGLFAYVLTKKAAKELLATSYPITGNAVDVFVSCTRKAAKLKLAISPIPFVVTTETSDTVGIK